MESVLLEPIQSEIDEDETVYPESDGEPMAETGIHVLAMLHLISAIRYLLLLHGRTNYYAIGNIFLYYQKRNLKAVKSPDVMVIKGVDGSYERRIFKTWEEKAVPSVIIEISSNSTAREDLTTKYQLYESLEVSEYFLFDPLEDFIPGQLRGHRLIRGRYAPIQPNPDGTLTSLELKAFLRPEDHLLRLLDFETGKPIPGLAEALFEADEARELAEQEAQRAEQEAQRAEQEAQRAEAAEAEVERQRQIIENLLKRVAQQNGNNAANDS